MIRLKGKRCLTLVTILFAVFFCMLSYAVITVSADDSSNGDEVVYDAADFANTANRTKADVINQYTEALAAGGTYINSNRTTYYDTPASLSAPYNAGVLNPDTLEAMEAMSNFYRWLIGVNPITVNQTSNSRMQAEALLRNFQFDHHISASARPVDMDDETWEAGYVCTHNILASGYTPSGAVTGWLNEGYSLSTGAWDTVGHRKSILTAGYQGITYGYSGRIAIGKNGSAGNAFPNAFAAFPAAGYMPNSLCYRAGTAWDVQLNTSMVKVSDASAVVVKVTNQNTGSSYECTNTNGYASISTSYIAFRQPSDGASVNATFTDSYKVEITGLQDTATGNPAKICYTVDFFDMAAESPFLATTSIKMNQTDYCYTGEAIIPDYTVSCNNVTLTEGVDYEVEYFNNTEVGTATVSVKGKGQYKGVTKATFTIREDTKNIEDCNVILQSGYYTYSGEEFTPDATVTEFGETLERGKDYEISYTDNINAGQGSATIYGIGDYHGSVTQYFTIYKNRNSLVINASPGTLEKGATYQIDCTGQGAVTYESSDESIFTVDESGLISCVSAGNATLTVRAAGNDNYYSSSKTISVKVSEDVHTMEVISMANGADNIARRKCAVCGKEEDFTTMTSFSVWWWTGMQGFSGISSVQNEGQSYGVSLRAFSPSDAEDTSLELLSSDESIMTVNNNNNNNKSFTFVGTGTVTLTIRAVNNPSIKLEAQFKVNHVYDQGVQTLAPTCTENGEKTFTCSVCGDVHTEAIPALGHTEQVVPGRAASCTESGITDGKICTVCGETLVAQEVIPALGHTEQVIPGRAASCTEDGLTDGKKCTVCGETLIAQEVIPAFGHTEEILPAKAETCTENGLTEGKKCSVCGEILLAQAVIPATGHTEEIIPGKAASCTESGLTDGKKCTVCGETLVAQTRIPALGHTEQVIPGRAASCTESGLSDGKKCTVCGETLVEQTEIPALGHTIQTTRIDEVYPTVDKEGSYTEVSSCVVCGEEMERTTIIIPRQGWLKKDNAWYFFTDNTMEKGWLVDSGMRYYLDTETGVMQTGWLLNEDNWYLLNSSGAMLTGWQAVGSKWYFFDSDGIMATGWLKDGGKWYYMNPSGSMATGWVKVGETWYYMSSGGAMQTGWQKINNVWYFFKSSGAMAASEWYGGYWLNANGSWTYQPIGSWKQNSAGWWFGDTSGWYAKNQTLKINDKEYTFNASGYWVQ